MLSKKWGLLAVIAVLLLLAGLALVDTRIHAAKAAGGGIFYESRPDEVALYLSEISFVRDTVTLPGGQDVQVLLPPGTYPNTLMLTENGQRVKQYRIAAQSAEQVYSAYSSVMSSYGSAYVVSWEPTDANADSREIKLEYLMSGGSWSAVYDMSIIDDTNVRMAFLAEIHNSALILDETTVYLVAGKVDISQQVNQMSQMTMNQAAVGYETTVELPAISAGAVDLQYVYPMGTITAEPGDTIFASLYDGQLTARRLVVWNASMSEETDVIYKVMNSSEIPLAEGIVRIYQDNLFRGSDFIEMTPISSEGSVTVGTLPDVRVYRTMTEEYKSSSDDYLHSVALELTNHSTESISVMVMDAREEGAWAFTYSQQPESDQDNLLRWTVTLEPGQTVTITYQYLTEY